MAETRLVLNRDAAEQRHPRAALVEQFIERNGVQLLQAARRYSASTADAEDAYQRTLEVLLTKAPEGSDDDRLLAWALTVARNEALQEQRRHTKIVDGAFEDLTADFVAESGAADEHVLELEHLGQG